MIKRAVERLHGGVHVEVSPRRVLARGVVGEIEPGVEGRTVVLILEPQELLPERLDREADVDRKVGVTAARLERGVDARPQPLFAPDGRKARGERLRVHRAAEVGQRGLHEALLAPGERHALIEHALRGGLCGGLYRDPRRHRGAPDEDPARELSGAREQLA